jgi:hypothetical protein
MDDYLSNTVLEGIGYNAGDLLLKTEKEKDLGDQSECQRKDYSDLYRFIVEVAGFTGRDINTLIYSDEQARAYIQQRKVYKHAQRLAEQLGDTEAKSGACGNRDNTCADDADARGNAGRKEHALRWEKTINEAVAGSGLDEAEKAMLKTVMYEKYNLYQNSEQSAKAQFIVALKPYVVSSISMAYQKLKNFKCVPKNDCGEPLSLDKLMVAGDHMTHFAFLVSTQISITNCNHPTRYLTDRHYRAAKAQERAIITRFKRLTRDNRGDRIASRIFQDIDDMQYLGTPYYNGR